MRISKSRIKQLIAESIGSVLREKKEEDSYEDQAKIFTVTVVVESFPGMEKKLRKVYSSNPKDESLKEDMISLCKELTSKFSDVKKIHDEILENLNSGKGLKDIGHYKSMLSQKEDIEKFLNEKAGDKKELKESSEWDLERLGRGRQPMRHISGNSFEEAASGTLAKYRKRYPNIFSNDDEFFIDFIIKTGKVTSEDDTTNLRKKLEMVKKEKESRRAADYGSKQGITGAGRMMFEKRKGR